MTSQAERRTVFVTGATGSIGLAAVKAMVEAGHEVVGVTRSAEGGRALRALGARPVEVDLFDAEALRAAMRGADAVVHLATKIPEGMTALMPGAWRMNDRLRREGTRNLIEAAEANGVRRFVFESVAFAYGDHGEAWIDEEAELRPVKFTRTAVEAERMLEAFRERGGEPVSLRFGRLYGPGRASRWFLDAVRKRQMPVLGSGRNFVSSIHSEDAGTAVAAALAAPPGAYNVADEEPVRMAEYLARVAEAAGAPAPRRMPYLVARLLMGQLARLMASSQRLSSERFREATGWRPRYRSALEAWPEVARSETPPAAQHGPGMAGAR